MKSYEQIYQEVVDLIAAKISTRDIAPHSSVFELATDSIQLFELVMTFEERFKITASYEDMMSVKTVNDVAHLIHRKTQLAPVRI